MVWEIPNFRILLAPFAHLAKLKPNHLVPIPNHPVPAIQGNCDRLYLTVSRVKPLNTTHSRTVKLIQQTLPLPLDYEENCRHTFRVKSHFSYLQVFITVPDRATARKITRTLLEKKLAACVQTIGPITSRYWWQGKIASSREYLCIAKTDRSSYSLLEKTVKALHPYEVPEIIALPIATGYHKYLDWLKVALNRPDPRRK
ncbi:divalent-cation tolerance protein CutA [candidate division WOR-3 bacterium]|nr:divalent-cation tolerance protein CutA [candidate division WOR-3 bacterium]